MEQHYHTPVLLNETIDALAIKPGGIYVDCTFGGGGHSKVILEKLSEKARPDDPVGRGKLIAFDQDITAKQNVPDDSRVLFVQQNFRHVARFLKLHNINEIDGLLADLGVSSHQFDEAERGFSFRFDAAMDMRMDQRQTLTAAEIIKTYNEQQLHKMFEQYGEVTNAKTLARTIVQVRNTAQLKTIDGFRNAIRGAVKGNPNKYFAQVFQAFRIEVNDEMGALKDLLTQIPKLLKPGGRAAIITFHSIEDRLVKNFFRRGTFDEPEENPFINDETVSELKVITKKPIVPTEKEMKQNPRSRSAKLRVTEKVNSE
ncbi:MAG: 16S rRNA (cytosine(1402)-N(4))-methyltransferase RsmH [Bacteroidetes bacterium]|nr:MAG: 16S rRNA (cytosine(1402)-N(4))-methyltransferase RsmH [Bacteroidota bacterium]